jgi:hypothetical protein
VTALTTRGTPRKRVSPGASLEERILLYTDRTGDCWVWTGCTDWGGYGHIQLEKRTQRVHRVAYEVWVGPIPEGMTVDHLCFNTSCIRPSHLRLLTRSENSRNQRSAFKTHCVNGHEYTDENTLIEVKQHGLSQRRCRTCRVAQEQRRYARRKAAALRTEIAA